MPAKKTTLPEPIAFQVIGDGIFRLCVKMPIVSEDTDLVITALYTPEDLQASLDRQHELIDLMRQRLSAFMDDNDTALFARHARAVLRAIAVEEADLSEPWPNPPFKGQRVLAFHDYIATVKEVRDWDDPDKASVSLEGPGERHGSARRGDILPLPNDQL